MKTLMPILGMAGRVAYGLALASIAGMNLLMGYIMFAPDDLPKPIYLAYKDEAPVLAGVAHDATAAPEPTEEAPKPGQGVMVDTGTKVVNLADPGGRRYLKAGIVIEVAPSDAPAHDSASGGEGQGADGEEDPMTAFNDEMSRQMPIVNDTLTSLLSSRSFESIYTVEGKEALRVEIMQRLNERLPDLHVIAVYFTEFIVQ